MGLFAPFILDNSARLDEWYLSWVAGKNVTYGCAVAQISLTDPRRQRKGAPKAGNAEARIALPGLGRGSGAARTPSSGVAFGLLLPYALRFRNIASLP
jgi:hypothetical protein